MNNEDSKVLLKYAACIFLPVLTVIVIALIYMKINQPYEKPKDIIKLNTIEELKSDDSFMNDLDALTLSLALPEGVLNRSFPERQSYVGGILQRYNHSDTTTNLKFSEEALKNLLNDINFWSEDEGYYGDYDKYLEEDEMVRSLTDDDIENIPNDSFVDGYERFLVREMMDSNSDIEERLFYDDSIVYICESKYNKYIIYYNIYDNVIENYKVVRG